MLKVLKERFREALSPLVADGGDSLDLIRPSQDPKFGDYQANMAMSLSKVCGRKPRDLAADIVNHLAWNDICEEPEVAGPGFINLRFRTDFLESCLMESVRDEQRLGFPECSAQERRCVIVDYSGPNVAKPMHVGHLRSTVIGNALSRMLRFQGHEVITDNHLGDWGTQFGMIIYGYRHFLDKESYDRNPVEELSRVYRQVRQLMDGGDEAVSAAVLSETAKLHSGDESNLALWREVLPHSMREIDAVYQRLGVRFDHTLGESFYHPFLAPIVTRLMERGIARETDGAIGIFFEGDEVPMLIRKKDGAFLYGTTDLATIEYRVREFSPNEILYLTDFRQSLHFEHLFQAVRLMGIDHLRLRHIKFGTVLGEDGKPFKTRSGDTVGLESLLDEAERRALAIVQSNDRSELSESEQREVAHRIGIGAIIYADLTQNRESDYVFSYDKMLAMNGNTATYMQYAVARSGSIFSKGEIDPEALRRSGATIRLQVPAERALALELLKFGDSVDFALRDYRPNLLTTYLFELANKYSTFFEQCPVLRAEDEPTRQSRLLLCDLTSRVLRKGLELLGIETVSRM